MQLGQRAALAAMVIAAFLLSPRLYASTFDVTVTGVPPGSPAGVLLFDFIDGGAPDNTVVLSALSSDGTLSPTSTATGNISGNGPWTFSDAGSFFDELQVPFDSLGTGLAFSFSITGHAPNAGSLPDAFSFFIFAPDLLTPLVTTNDPTGSNALFLVNLDALTVYTPEPGGISLTVTAANLPEPGSLLLVGVAMAALLIRKRDTAARGFEARAAT